MVDWYWFDIELMDGSKTDYTTHVSKIYDLCAMVCSRVWSVCVWHDVLTIIPCMHCEHARRIASCTATATRLERLACGGAAWCWCRLSVLANVAHRVDRVDRFSYQVIYVWVCMYIILLHVCVKNVFMAFVVESINEYLMGGYKFIGCCLRTLLERSFVVWLSIATVPDSMRLYYTCACGSAYGAAHRR